MVAFRVLLSVFFAMLIVQGLEAKKKDKDKDKDKKKDKLPDLSGDDLDKLTDMVEALEARVDELAAGGASGSSCPGNKVHFFFHGDDDDHTHKEGDQHVHIDLHLDHRDHDDHHAHAAHCEMTGTKGYVRIVQSDDDKHANFLFNFEDLGDANSMFKVHVHEFGYITDSCDKMGGHYALHGKDIGDLGTLDSDKNGAINNFWKNDTMLELYGDHSIVGRGIIVHSSDGVAVGCCVIGVVSEDYHHDDHSMEDHSHDDHAHHHGHAHKHH